MLPDSVLRQYALFVLVFSTSTFGINISIGSSMAFEAFPAFGIKVTQAFLG